MAGQFDKFVKILGTGAKPDRAVGTWKGTNPEGGPAGQPVEMSIPVGSPQGASDDVKKMRETGVTSSGIGDSMAVARQQKSGRSKLAADEKSRTFARAKKTRAKIQNENLSTTTMRLNEATGEAYDTEETKPAPSGRVMPARQANPKYVAADVQRQNEDLQRFTDADTMRNVGDQDSTGEAAFSRSEAAKGSTLRSLNGVTYDMKDYSDYLDTRPANEISKATSPYDISEFDPSTPSSPTPTAADRPSSIVPTKPLNTKMVDDRESEIEPEEDRRPVDVQIQHKEVREYEQKSKGPTTVEYGDTLAEENTKTRYKEPARKDTVERTRYERPKAVIEGDIDDSAAYEGDWKKNKKTGKVDRIDTGDLKPGYDDPNSILSTTMREVDAEGPAAPVRERVQIRRPRNAAPYDKPAVASTGTAIPQRVVDTYTGSDTSVDEEQAKRDRANRTPLTSTGPYDPNKTPGRDTFGRTPERRATQAAIREERAASLAAEGKTMTTVAPHIMASAKALAATSRFGFQKDDPFFETTQFLDHPAIQEATIAHATGTHHDFSLLHQALGGRAPEIARRREAWFKVATRKLRGNPEAVKGEFDVLTASVNKGTTPTTVARKLERGQKPGITLNGQTPTLAPAAPIADVQTPTRAGTRAMHDNTATNIAYQLQQSAKEAHRIMTFEPLKTTTMRLNEATGEAYDSDNKEELLKNTAQSTGETSSGVAPAGSGFVTVRNKNKPNQPAVTRPLTKKELLNKENVPTVDDSKSRSGAVQKEGESDSSSIIDRLKKGPKLDESNN
jgi:hypothetical protein